MCFSKVKMANVQQYCYFALKSILSDTSQAYSILFFLKHFEQLSQHVFVVREKKIEKTSFMKSLSGLLQNIWQQQTLKHEEQQEKRKIK